MEHNQCFAKNIFLSAALKSDVNNLVGSLFNNWSRKIIKKACTAVLICLFFMPSISIRGQQRIMVQKDIPIDSIRLSDPYILADQNTQMYYMTGSRGMLWKSKDLKTWDGPYRVTKTDSTSWMGPRPMIWAAELHTYKGKYYY